MRISKFIEDALTLAVHLEDRASGQHLQRLASELHLLYFQPEKTTPVLDELAEHGRLVSTTRSAVLAQLSYTARDVNGLLREIEDLLRSNGQHLLSPVEYSAVSEMVRRKEAIRRQIFQELREEIDTLIKVPARYKSGEEPYAEIKERARAIRDQMDHANRLLETAFASFSSAEKRSSGLKRHRFPRTLRYTVVAIVIVAIVYGVLFVLGDTLFSYIEEMLGMLLYPG